MITDRIDPFVARFPMSIRDVLKVLNNSGQRIVFAVDSDGRCIGALSDGDIRRALLAGAAVDDDASAVLRTDILTATSGATVPDLVEKSGARGVDHVPILDNDYKIRSVFVRDPKLDPGTRENPVVIMAGGLGMRLRPITDRVPKPMIEVAGKPIIRHIVDKLLSEGFRKILISVNYLGEQIKNYFDGDKSLGVAIGYLTEEEPLGTAGSLTLLARDSDLPVLVINGDILMEASPSAMLEHHIARRASLTVAAKVVETEVPFGVIETEGLEIRSIVEKPSYHSLVSAGIYVVNRDVIESIPKRRPVDMPELIQESARRGKTQVFPLFEDWIDVGRPSDLTIAQDLYREKPAR